MAANEPDGQNHPPFSRTTPFSVSMMCWSRFSQQCTVFEIVQTAAEPLIKHNQSGSSLSCWSHTIGSMNFKKTFFFVCEWHSTCKQFAYIVFLLDLGSFTNLVICIYVLKIQIIKLAHTFEIGCF